MLQTILESDENNYIDYTDGLFSIFIQTIDSWLYQLFI